MSSTPIEQSEAEKPKPGTVFERAKHLRYLQGCMRLLPASYAAQESNRLTLLYFVVSGLDILDQLDVLKNKESIIDWIYSLQVLPDKNEPGAWVYLFVDSP
jgi:geranylgeranyl transferase type-1 subunit beta